MSHKFNPGDLALTLVDYRGWPALTEVQLCEFLPAGSIGLALNGMVHTKCDVWVCDRADDAMCRLYEPRQLMPLRGDFEPEKQKRQEQPA